MGWFTTARQVARVVTGACNGGHRHGRWVRIKGGKKRTCSRCGHVEIVMGLASRRKPAAKKGK